MLAEAQQGVVSRAQLLELGLGRGAIAHRIETGALIVLRRGVYAVGHRALPPRARIVAALLDCGPGAVVSHASAAALWGIRPPVAGPIEVVVPNSSPRIARGITIHRSRVLEPHDLTRRLRIPVTSPARTIIDIAPRLSRKQLERAISEADRLDLVSPDRLRDALDGRRRTPGVSVLRATLDARTFRLTASELERLFLAIVKAAGLPLPETGRRVNGFVVDFFWPALGLVVEADGLRYHRTPAQQARDRLRDQAHTAAGLVALRFTHEQIAKEPAHVVAVLRAVAARQSPASLHPRAGTRSSPQV
jgi:very-short-patch-repair endonuclease